MIRIADLLVHDHNAPGNGPLLQTDEAATERRGGQLADIHGDLGGFDADGQAIDDASDDEHTLALGGADQGRSDEPVPVSYWQENRERGTGRTDQIQQPMMMEGFRPILSESTPEIKAPSHEPAGMAAVIPPWTRDRGPLQLGSVAFSGCGP